MSGSRSIHTRLEFHRMRLSALRRGITDGEVNIARFRAARAPKHEVEELGDALKQQYQEYCRTRCLLRALEQTENSEFDREYR